MNNNLSVCILLCLAILASGQAAAQGTYGTKVQAGDPDVGLPLSQFSNIPVAAGTATTQWNSYLSYWDIGSTPGIYDDKDVVYLQFGSALAAANRIVRTNNIRMVSWGNYPAGSYVKAGESDLGQQLLPWAAITNFPAAIFTGFHYMNVVGGAEYNIGDPIYLKAGGIPAPLTDTNDIRITPFAGFPAGSRVSLADTDAAKPLTPFVITFAGAGGPVLQGPGQPLFPVGRLQFFNANGNVQQFTGLPIYDDGDVVYFDVIPLDVVSPNDVRLY